MRRVAAARRRAWPLRGLGAVLGAALVLIPQPAAAATPTVVLNPDSGGPGVKVSLRGTGFCGAAACGPVTVTMGGYQVAGQLRPDAAGAFRTTFVVPGGLSSGQIHVIARQTHDDGNETQAMAGFVYSPSKGEAAERKAAEDETLQQLVNPTRPAANRGVPLASVAASAQPVAGGARPTVATPAVQGSPARDESVGRWWPYAAAIAGLAAVVAWVVLLARRRTRLDPARHLRR